MKGSIDYATRFADAKYLLVENIPALAYCSSYFELRVIALQGMVDG
ncbi:MAG: hypothetical protein V4717_19125 [Bacteroidota bacterium]